MDHLYDYLTGEDLGPVTPEQITASDTADRFGLFRIEGRTVYIQASGSPRKTVNLPADFFCINCDRWRPVEKVDVDEEPQPNPTCARCGEGFQCGDCGYDIDRAGNCQRTLSGMGDCPTTPNVTETP